MKIAMVLMLAMTLLGCQLSSKDYQSISAENQNLEQRKISGLPTEVKQDICSVDFKNFSYSWLDGDVKGSFSLRDGVYTPETTSAGDKETIRLANVYYSDITADNLKEAVIVLSISTGGSAIPHLVYVYEFQGSPRGARLLWSFESGDRAAGGLRSVYVESGDLVVETYNEQPNQGDCCPLFYTKARYRWRNGRFDRFNDGVVPNPTRSASFLAVSSVCTN